jgi:FAD/FMN-containing dehydrogenase
LASAPTWRNWSGNIVHQPAADGVKYYAIPANLSALKAVIAEAAKLPGATVRVSGQRHSQTPLVADDNRGAVPKVTTQFLVDLSCYHDLAPAGDRRIVLGPGPNQVTVNTGVREDELEAFLTQNNLMLQVVTAGGFFCLGGMTAVDVHGGTVNGPVFAETVSAFHLVLADGSSTTIDKQSPSGDGWHPLQFARVSLGGLGIVTSVTIDVLPRPYATSLSGAWQEYGVKDKAAFIDEFRPLLANHTRLEIFFTPYATYAVGFPLYAHNFLALWWDVVADPSPKTPNRAPQPYPATACDLANKAPPEYGAPVGQIAEITAQNVAVQAQYMAKPGNTTAGALEDGIYNPAIITAAAFKAIESQVDTANAAHSELWLSSAAHCIFMSYYIPLPNLGAEGLGVVWDGLDAVARIVTQDGNFHIAAPMEFRFVKGGDSAMSGAYAANPTWFVNLDLIAWVDPNQAAVNYPPKLLKFFADVERAWVAMGGFPHNGKIYGFYDPADAPGTWSRTGPFNPNYMAALRDRRGAPLQAYDAFRARLDPNGLFHNGFLKQILGR